MAYGKGVVADEPGDSVAHVADFTHFNQNRYVVEQDSVIWIVVPRQNRKALLGLQHVGRRRVINYNCVSAIATKLGHIFDKNSVHKGAVLTEESSCAVTIWVHHIHQGVSILQHIWNRGMLAMNDF